MDNDRSRSMHSTPEKGDDYPQKIKAEKWQMDLLRLNPEYTCWGPHEDYMCKKGSDEGGGGWDSRVFIDSWKKFDWALDEYNEVVNFYFTVYRGGIACPDCHETGLNKETEEIRRSFYDFEGVGNRWCDAITQDEVYELVKQGRLWSFVKPNVFYDDKKKLWQVWKREEGKEAVKETIEEKDIKFPTAEEVNKVNRRDYKGSGLNSHDCINSHILLKTRANRLGVYGECHHCDGEGIQFTDDKAKVGLVLWFLHPRKGCSRGVEIKSLEKEDIPAAQKYLTDAAARNAERFSKLPHYK